MNEEQLKQLKKDDEIFIRARYERLLNCGDVSFSHSSTESRGREVSSYGYTHPSNVILQSELQPAEKPKYDPCRLFKKGDRVRVVEWSGRNPVLPFMDCKVGDIGTVIKDEETTSFFVRLHLEGKYEKDMPYCHLELVTPIEEQEPYSVGESTDYFSVEKDDAELCLYWKDKHPNAKAAAEAERDRLNAEHRKEQR